MARGGAASGRTMTRAAVVFAAMLVLAPPAIAQEATPTPEATPDDAVPVPRSEPRKRARPIPDPGVTPSLGLLQAHVFAPGVNEIGYTAALPVFVGATFHPMPARVSPFSNVGVEMQFHPDGSRMSWVPTGRFGTAILMREREGEPDFLRRLFPAFQVYGLVGWRIANGQRGDAARLGVGVASPILMPLSAGESCVPAPSLLEATMDVSDFKGGAREYQVRLGWFF